MKLLSEAPQEKKVQKYVFEEQQKEEGLTKEKVRKVDWQFWHSFWRPFYEIFLVGMQKKVLDVFWDKMGTQKEKQTEPLKQDLMQGATDEEWNWNPIKNIFVWNDRNFFLCVVGIFIIESIPKSGCKEVVWWW